VNAVVVTASRRPQKLSDAVVTTELISHDEIVRSGAQDLNGILTRHLGVQPEVAVFASGGVQVQGLNSERVAVLIDGEPLTGRIDGQLDLARIPASAIDHIEIVKGPQSTLYGSAAMGGVINVITRDAYTNTPHFTGDVVAGSLDRFDANAALRGGIGNVRGLFGLGRRQFDIQPGHTTQAGARERRWDTDGKVHWSATPDASFEAALLATTEDQRWQGGPLYFFSDNDQINGHLSASITHGRQHFTPTLYYSTFSHLSRQATLPEPVSDSGDHEHETLFKGEVVYNVELPKGFLDAGAEVRRDGLTTDRIRNNAKSLYTTEPYAQYTLDIGPWSIVPGARMTYSQAWGNHFTPKIAVLYHPVPSVALRVSAGAGYRAPDFKELYLSFFNLAAGAMYRVVGNPSLRPETSTNVTGGVEWTSQSSFARVQVYNNNFDRFIETELVGDSSNIAQYTYNNIDNGITRGVDLEAGTTLGRVALDGSYSYLDAFQRGTNLPLLNRTKNTARLSADYTFPFALRTSVTGLYTGRTPTERAADSSSINRSSYLHIDANIRHTIAHGLDAQAGVQNALRAQPAQWPGPTGRQWYAGLAVDKAF
jgi:outer membrane receptor for ferrienterochelin and colicins